MDRSTTVVVGPPVDWFAANKDVELRLAAVAAQHRAALRAQNVDPLTVLVSKLQHREPPDFAWCLQWAQHCPSNPVAGAWLCSQDTEARAWLLDVMGKRYLARRVVHAAATGNPVDARLAVPVELIPTLAELLNVLGL